MTNLQSTRDWRDTDDELVSCHWLTGQAGAGKSVLTSHIIRHLQDLGVDTCFYFFRHGQKAQQTVSSLLRSLAFQMALIHPSARETLFSMEEAGVRFDKDDERGLWKTLFVNRILQSPISTTQYWVIGGLDECTGPEKLFVLLEKFDSAFSIGIFFSSRRLAQLEKHVARFRPRVYRHHVSAEETKKDIKRFVENNSDELSVNPEDRPTLVERLVRKSDGAFLWTELVVEALRRVFSEEEVNMVLDEVPPGMAPLYDRILESMAKNHRQIKLTKAILEWTVSGTRLLRTAELQAILNYDSDTKIRNIERTIDELCGQLLYINNDMVRLLHATARDFLLSENSNPIFGLDPATANEHLAMVCLKYLTSDEMKPPRHPALISKPVSRSPFLDYACTSFSEHLAASSPVSDRLFLLVDKLFRGNVLSWVEYILRDKQSLYYLTRASKNIRRYLDQRSKDTSSLESQFKNIDGWQTDLLRIVLKFGNQLLRDPSAVYFILPPLCPTTSRIHGQLSDTTKGLRLSGLTNSSWDDCICSIEYRDSRALSLAGGDGIFAIGMKSGAVKLYQQSTCSETTSLDHGEPVTFLRFSNSSHLLASAGYRQIKMWSINGELVWKTAHEGPLSAMSSTEAGESLVVANRQRNIMTLHAGDGTNEGVQTPSLRGLAQVVDICPKAELLAFAICGYPPEIWSIQDSFMITSCHLARDEPTMPIIPASQVLFNPNSAIELLAVSYQDGELAIFKTWAGGDREVKSLSAEAFTLTSTPDGRTLASGDALGTIKIWDFETLTLFYCIKSAEYAIRPLAFSADGFRLYDIRETKTKVWEPAVLVRKTINDESGVGESTAMSVPAVGRGREAIDIMQIHAPPNAGCVFAGRGDGSVVAYDWVTGDMISTLYSHSQGGFVTNISWNHSMIATADNTKRIEVHSLRRTASNNPWVAGGKQFETKLNENIRELYLHPKEPWLLVHQAKDSTIIDTRTRAEYLLPSKAKADYRAWLWLSQISPSTLLLGARSHSIDIYKIDTLGTKWQARVWHPTWLGSPVEQMIDRLLTDKQEMYIAVLLEPQPQMLHLPRLERTPAMRAHPGVCRARTEDIFGLSRVQSRIFGSSVVGPGNQLSQAHLRRRTT